jgi:hypothetical protein
MSLLAQSVPLAIEFTKEPVGKRMDDFPRHLGGRQILLRDIGRMDRFIHQHVIPGFVPRGAGARDLLVPFIGPLKGRIDIENNPDIVEQPVVNDLPDLEFGFVFRHGDHRSRIKGYLTAA